MEEYITECRLNELLRNLNQLHTTERGITRIKKNLSLETEDVIAWCKAKIDAADAVITRNGKNWYVKVDGCVLTVNAYSYTVITAHREKRKKMMKKYKKIEHIKAVIWGDESNTIIIAVHGDQSNKEDVPIQILAENAAQRGIQVISFDLPENGERKDEKIPCTVQNCVKELNMIMDYVKKRWKHLCLFANSMGAYFSMVAYQNEHIERAWFLSPLVDMRRMIENMMKWFQVSEKRLKDEKKIDIPMEKPLYWDYYCYVKEHPINNWNVPTYILRGAKDTTCEEDTIQAFLHNCSNATMQLVEDSEHYFHTEYDLEMLKKWFGSSME